MSKSQDLREIEALDANEYKRRERLRDYIDGRRTVKEIRRKMKAAVAEGRLSQREGIEIQHHALVDYLIDLENALLEDRVGTAYWTAMDDSENGIYEGGVLEFPMPTPSEQRVARAWYKHAYNTDTVSERELAHIEVNGLDDYPDEMNIIGLEGFVNTPAVVTRTFDVEVHARPATPEEYEHTQEYVLPEQTLKDGYRLANAAASVVGLDIDLDDDEMLNQHVADPTKQ